MKKLIILALVLSGTVANAQVELKGILLGERFDKNSINTTVAEIDGIIFARKIKDGRIYSLVFLPSNDGVNIARVYIDQVASLISGVESKYDIKFDRVNEGPYNTDDYTMLAEKDGVRYFCTVEYNRYYSPPLALSFLIQNIDLLKINKAEKRVKASSDF